jgi:hypothetical protein
MKKIVCELCGSNEFTKDDDGLFVCDYCQTKYTPAQAKSMLVEGTVSIDKSQEHASLLSLANVAWEAGNFVEALSYSNRVLEIDPASKAAWLLKGKSAARLSSLNEVRFIEMTSAFSQAILNSTPEEEDELSSELSMLMTQTCSGIFEASLKNVQANPNQAQVLQDHFGRSQEMIDTLNKAYEVSPGPVPLRQLLVIAKNLKSLVGNLHQGQNSRANAKFAKEIKYQMQREIDFANARLKGPKPDRGVSGPTGQGKNMGAVDSVIRDIDSAIGSVKDKFKKYF